MDSNNYQLPRNIDRYLAALSKVYELDGNRELQELIVNSQVRVVEEWSYDNWDGGIAGHALYLILPEPLFLRVHRKKDEIQDTVQSAINKLHNIHGEFIEKVFLEIDGSSNEDWRKASGLVLTANRIVSEEAQRRIWADDAFRLFLGHKSEIKTEVGKLKNQLQYFGISAFVAHEDIRPSEAWQDEIENALTTMDGFVALMTPNFHDSEWTDQEVGFAFARGVPRIAVMLGATPYGFMGKFQGLRGSWETASLDIAGILIKVDRMFSVYLNELRNCSSFDRGNVLGGLLPHIVALSPEQVDELVTIYNENVEVRGAFAFNGTKRRIYGEGLVAHLNRIDKRTFKYGEHKIEVAN
jgi:hypothetical protein